MNQFVVRAIHEAMANDDAHCSEKIIYLYCQMFFIYLDYGT